MMRFPLWVVADEIVIGPVMVVSVLIVTPRLDTTTSEIVLGAKTMFFPPLPVEVVCKSISPLFHKLMNCVMELAS